MSKRTIIAALGFTLIATSMVACGPGEDGEEIDNATAQQNLTQSTTELTNNTVAALKFLENSDLLKHGLSATQSCREGDLVPDIDGNIPDDIGTDCKTEIDVKIETGDEVNDLNSFLKSRIFIQGNIESQDDTHITYLLKGANVCADISGEDKQGCLDFFNKTPIRLDVSSPAPKALDIKLLIGANKLKPLDLSISPNSIAVTARLAALKQSASAIATALDTELPDLPATMEGTITAGLKVQAGKKIETLLEVNAAVKIADAALGYNLSVGTGVISKITVDGVAETVRSTTNMGAIDLGMPVFSATESNDLIPFESSATDALKHAFKAHIGGINADILFDAKNEVVTATGLGLGDTKTTVNIDGSNVFAIDINANAGRRVDLSLKEVGDNMEVTVAPSLDIAAMFAMAKIQSTIPQLGYDDWSLNDILSIKIDGASPAKFLIGDGIKGIKMLAGKLTLNSSTANITHSVDAGMCLLENATNEEPVDPDGDSDESSESHPLSSLSAQACE